MQEITGLSKQEIYVLCDTKTAWTGKEVKHLVHSMKSSKFINVLDIKVGDVLAANGLQHPSIVLSVKGDNIHSILITTEPTCYNIIKQCNSRLLPDSYFTYTMTMSKKEYCIGKVWGIYDNISELRTIKKTIKEFYSKL